MDIRVVIADDEPLARQLLERLVSVQPGLSVAGVADSGDAVEKLVASSRPDLVFLDVEMPGMTGVELAARMRTMPSPPLIVLVTAFDRFAVEAFDLDVLDYVVKPVAKARFARAIERARVAIARRRARAGDEPRATSELPGAYVTLRQRDELVRVAENDIVWLEAASQYVNVHTQSGSFVVAQPLSRYSSQLAGPYFRRVHRSAVVNINMVRRVLRKPNGVHELQLANGASVPLSRSRKAMLKEMLEVSAANRAHG